MHAPNQSQELDEATLAFAEQVFDSARSGDSARLAELLGQGMPANLRNHAGDSLLMLASYHGHLEASLLLLQHGADHRRDADQRQQGNGKAHGGQQFNHRAHARRAFRHLNPIGQNSHCAHFNQKT